MTKKCDSCNKMRSIQYHITEINNKEVESLEMCVRCGLEYIKKLDKGKKPKTDVSNIETPEDLLSFLMAVDAVSENNDVEACPCGMTEHLLREKGRMGCPKCYSHFGKFMEDMVHPFHKATKHVGKVPKNWLKKKTEQDPVEKMKLLKLRYAKALELEEYEQAAEINEEIKQLVSLQKSSSDQ